MPCPNCSGSQIHEAIETESFVYGGAKLRATVPVMNCLDCDFSWTDFRAEDIFDKAISVYLEEWEPTEPFTRADEAALSAEADYWENCKPK